VVLNVCLCEQVPKFEFTSNARPSLFAYPGATKPQKKETATKVATAVLSTTAKVKAREKKKAAADGDVNMDVVSGHHCVSGLDLFHIQDDKAEGKTEDVEMKEAPAKGIV